LGRYNNEEIVDYFLVRGLIAFASKIAVAAHGGQYTQSFCSRTEQAHIASHKVDGSETTPGSIYACSISYTQIRASPIGASIIHIETKRNNIAMLNFLAKLQIQCRSKRLHIT
jgi:hypothetical protein